MHTKQPLSTRTAAAEILLQLFREKTSVKPIFEKVVKKHHLSANDRNLVMQLVYGVLRRRQNIDRIIEILSRTPITKLEPFIHQALAVALYQIFFLERIPDSAAVNEAVESCKKKKIHKRLHGFVNGVLRQAIRQKEALLIKFITSKTGNKILNHPAWLTARWRRHYGEQQTASICLSNSHQPPFTLHLNSYRIDIEHFCQKLQNQGIKYTQGQYNHNAITLVDFQGPLTSIPGFTEGLFQIQGEAAQLATMLLGPFRRGGTYLDGCAGVGGKTSHMLELAKKHKLTIHASEPESYRIGKLRENISRLFQNSSPEELFVHECQLQEIEVNNIGTFDGILLDAPCSGTGVIGRNPDIRWNRNQSDIEKYSRQQMGLLSHAATLLKAGGILVYATCSIEPEENQDLIKSFLAANPEFTLTDCTEILPEEAKTLVYDNYFRPLPDQNIDGFFAARLKKSE